MKQPVDLYRAYVNRADDERASLRLAPREGVAHVRDRVRRAGRWVMRR